MLGELLEVAQDQKLLSGDITWIKPLRNMFAHGSDTVLNAPMFLSPFEAATGMIAQLFEPSSLPLS
jgi:hypothetical protein